MTGESWKITLPCTRAEAEAIRDDISVLVDLDHPPTLMTSEADPKNPDRWVLDAYFDVEPDEHDMDALLKLVPSARIEDARGEKLAPQDWVTISQTNLKPITTGRFHVYTETYADTLQPGQIGLRIEAGQAFGTGQHETTSGCLQVLDRLAARHRFRNALDLGTGSGILALAIVKRWRSARVIASDIDPLSVEVATENVRVNGERVGRGRGKVELFTAAGMAHSRLKAAAPYDLIVANILAGPLIELAPSIVKALAPGGIVVLAGLLNFQAAGVIAAYRALGCRPILRHDVGEWPTLVLRKRALTGAMRGRGSGSTGAAREH